MIDFCGIVADSSKFARIFFRKNVLYKIDSQDAVYLTFDDGPTPQVTDWVLNTLNKYNAKATFFLLGKNALKNQELFLQIQKEGHTIGNHTFDHAKGLNYSAKAYMKNILKANKILKTELFRPPYGRFTPKQARIITQAGFKIVLWSIISCDYNYNIDKRRIYEIVKKRIKPGSIIVFHDSLKAEKNMKYALERLLDEYSEIYKFEAIKNYNVNH